MPVDISDATGLLAADLVILYDPAVATATSVGRTALSSGQTLVANLGVPGSIRISLFGVAPLAGSGTLLTIDFTSIGPGGEGTALHIDALQLNEGRIPAGGVDGAWCVQAPAQEVQDLAFPAAASPAGAATLAWSAAPSAAAYNVYRAGRADFSDAVCLLRDLPVTAAGDGGDLPAPGAVHFFVVTSRNCSGESTAGWSSAGVERVLPQRCP